MPFWNISHHHVGLHIMVQVSILFLHLFCFMGIITVVASSCRGFCHLSQNMKFWWNLTSGKGRGLPIWFVSSSLDGHGVDGYHGDI